MHVEFTFDGTLGDAAGVTHVERELSDRSTTTVGDALRTVLADHPSMEPLTVDSKGRLRAHVALRRNGEDVRGGAWLETPVSDGDALTVEPTAKGGC